MRNNHDAPMARPRTECVTYETYEGTSRTSVLPCVRLELGYGGPLDLIVP